ncbi:hypothetical protein K9L97_03360 [Candidatus Woesearchaeota archaeon]|nr:hypothetical protein [Candidatus Woesearchaeota archaeon]
MSFIISLWSSFLLGLLAPITATCILPLYPGFIAFLTNESTAKKNSLKLGLFVSIGLLTFMLSLGFIFTTIFQVSLTNVIQIISPIAFIILALFSILLIFNINIFKIKQLKVPTSKKPNVAALLYGLFFGAIIIPCNPGILAVFFTRAISTTGFLGNMLNFLFFAIGMALPLLILSVATQKFSKQIIGFLTKNSKLVNIIAGIIMLLISMYYLVFNFKIFG